MTYIPTWTGFLYLAVVIDAFICEIVGWSSGLNELFLRKEIP
jgi:putative transposase